MATPSPSPSSQRAVIVLTALVLGACSGSGSPGDAQGGTAPIGVGGSAAPAPTAGTGTGQVAGGSGGAGASPATSTGGTGTPVLPSGGFTAGGMNGGQSGGIAAGGTPAAGAGPSGAGTGGGLTLPTVPSTNKDHCLYGYDPLPSDATMKSGPSIVGNDTVVQPEVLEWMTQNKWQGGHVVWHAVRGCSSGTARGLLGPLGYPNICEDYPVLIPTDQNCSTASSGDGYQFLLFHRHMIESLKQLWPQHAADFDGFSKFPTTPEELPEMWKDKITWNQTILDAAKIADEIDKPENLALFPDEGSVGYWLQCPVGARKPGFAPQIPYVGLHFNLHDQWTRGANAQHGLNNGQVNITNYMFWKLHGWIDKVWEKYRVAKGLTKDPVAMQKYKSDLVAQCREMDIEIEILKQRPGDGPMLDCPPDVDETGDFHTKVRPILESESNRCSGCHGPAQTSPYAGLTLGGHISSKCVIERLKKASVGGGQYKLVEPGDPEKSWLYLKAAGKAEAAACVSPDPMNKPCNTATMPPSGRTMTDAELKVLADWITAGAN